MLVAARINPSGCVEKSEMIALARAHMCLRKWARKYLRTTAAAAAPPTPPPRAELEPDPRRSSLMDTMSGALETLTEAIGLAESAAPEVEPVVQSAQPAAALAALGLDTVPSPAAARKAHFKAAKRVGNGERRAALDDALATILTALDGARVPEQSLPPAAAPAPAKRQSKRASGSEADFHDSFELMSRENPRARARAAATWAGEGRSNSSRASFEQRERPRARDLWCPARRRSRLSRGSALRTRTLRARRSAGSLTSSKRVRRCSTPRPPKPPPTPAPAPRACG